MLSMSDCVEAFASQTHGKEIKTEKKKTSDGERVHLYCVVFVCMFVTLHNKLHAC